MIMHFKELQTNLKADLQRYAIPESKKLLVGWLFLANPRFWPILILRLAIFSSGIAGLRLMTPILTWVNIVLFGIEFTAKCQVGPGLMLPHTVGTVVGANKIGANVTIFQGVTLGAKFVDLNYDETKRPIIEDNVSIGAGAKVLGGITIGMGAKIAPNALVLEDVAAGALAIGNPALIQQRSKPDLKEA
jgi:serine O-acetyltransferase